MESVPAGKLIPCPFCGCPSVKLQSRERGYYWKESLVAEVRIERASYYGVCNRCHARGGVASGRFVGYVRTYDFIEPFNEARHIEVPLPDWVTTRDEVKRRAIELWNRRA